MQDQYDLWHAWKRENLKDVKRVNLADLLNVILTPHIGAPIIGYPLAIGASIMKNKRILLRQLGIKLGRY